MDCVVPPLRTKQTFSPKFSRTPDFSDLFFSFAAVFNEDSGKTKFHQNQMRIVLGAEMKYAHAATKLFSEWGANSISEPCNFRRR